MKVFHKRERGKKSSETKLRFETKKYLREFSNATTLHGVHYVGEENTHFLERLCWLIAIILCALFCGNEITKVWYRWQNSPVIISFAQEPTSVASIPYPALTICPENKIKKSVIDMKENFNIIEAKLNGTSKFESKDEQLFFEAISMLCSKRDKNFKLMLPKHKPTYDHLALMATKLSPQIDDIFEACYFESKEINCTNIFRPILMFHGICYVFNMLDDKDLYAPNIDRFPLEGLKRKAKTLTWDPERGYLLGKQKTKEFPLRNGAYVGPRYGLQFILKSDPKEIQEICAMNDADFFRISLQAPTEYPNPYFGNHFHVNPGSDTSISLHPSTITTAPELRGYQPQLRGCNYPEDKKLTYFRTYTKNNCMWEFENRVIRDNCGCQVFFMPYIKNDNASFCTVSDIIPPECGEGFEDVVDKEIYDDVEEKIDSDSSASAFNCLPSCLETTYEYHVSHSRYKHWQNQNSSTQYSAINLYFETASIFGKHRSELYGITDFIASCGGLLGLFTGFSLITAVEILYFSTLRLFCKLRKNRKIEQENTE